MYERKAPCHRLLLLVRLVSCRWREHVLYVVCRFGDFVDTLAPEACNGLVLSSEVVDLAREGAPVNNETVLDRLEGYAEGVRGMTSMVVYRDITDRHAIVLLFAVVLIQGI